MTGSSPLDLAVMFRGLPRRQREAVAAAEGSEGAAGIVERIDSLVAAAASLVGSPADPLAVAEAIEAIPADQWSDEVLDALRGEALQLGRGLRDLEHLGEENH